MYHSRQLNILYVKIIVESSSRWLHYRPCFVRFYWHDDVIKWKHLSRYWHFVRGIHRRTVDSPHIGQWRGALMFSLICAYTYGWANNQNAGDLRRHCAPYNVTVISIMLYWTFVSTHHSLMMQYADMNLCHQVIMVTYSDRYWSERVRTAYMENGSTTY